jgi:hypothetical protein
VTFVNNYFTGVHLYAFFSLKECVKPIHRFTR